MTRCFWSNKSTRMEHTGRKVSLQLPNPTILSIIYQPFIQITWHYDAKWYLSAAHCLQHKWSTPAAWSGFTGFNCQRRPAAWSFDASPRTCVFRFNWTTVPLCYGYRFRRSLIRLLEVSQLLLWCMQSVGMMQYHNLFCFWQETEFPEEGHEYVLILKAGVCTCVMCDCFHSKQDLN